MASFQNDRIYFQTPRGSVVSRVYTKGRNKGKLYWRIEWNPGFGPYFSRGFTSAQALFAQEVAKQMDRYIPFQTGTLKNSVHLASDYQRGLLVYNTPYARRQYYLHPAGQGVHDGRRGSYWGQRCDADFHPYFVRFARRAVQKELGSNPTHRP